MTSCDAYDALMDPAAPDGREGCQVLVAPWRSYGGRTHFCGRVATVRCLEDNTAVREALSRPGQGRVLVIDGAGSLTRALMGDVVGTLAVGRGWAGVVVNGAVRDSAALAGLDLGVLALGTVPRPSRKEGLGVLDVVLDLCGARVAPGDVLVADGDGVVVIPGSTDLPSSLLP